MALASIVMRHEAQLRRASAQIREARSVINDASNGMNSAAEALLGSWEGDAANAFAMEQLGFKSWVQKMIAVIEEIVSVIDSANDAYSNIDEQVKSMINSK